MYFHTNEPNVIDRLADALNFANAHGKRVRIDVDDAGNLKYKIGEGMWSEPISSTKDPYRDASQSVSRPKCIFWSERGATNM